MIKEIFNILKGILGLFRRFWKGLCWNLPFRGFWAEIMVVIGITFILVAVVSVAIDVEVKEPITLKEECKNDCQQLEWKFWKYKSDECWCKKGQNVQQVW